MSRHGYSDDLDHTDWALWRGRVASAIRGKRGQKMLVALRDALLAMPEKRLVSGVLQRKDGDCCALGALARSQGADYTYAEDDEVDQEELNPDLAALFDVAECLVREVEYENDEGAWQETPEKRYERMLRWVTSKIKEPAND